MLNISNKYPDIEPRNFSFTPFKEYIVYGKTINRGNGVIVGPHPLPNMEDLL